MRRMEAIKSIINKGAEYEAIFIYGGREYEAAPITGAALLTLIQEIEDEGGAVYFYGHTVAICHPDGGVTEVALS